MEIPWISTNFTAQWCLKVIVCLDLIPAALPATLRELETCSRCYMLRGGLAEPYAYDGDAQRLARELEQP